MRRDVCYFFPLEVHKAYDACLSAAKNAPFERDCKEEPFHTFSFGLNFSFKYNMNGGSCTIRFIPVNGGSAVNMRFTLAQGAGGRCEKYAEDLIKQAQKHAGAVPVRCNIDVEEFLKEENRVYAEKVMTQQYVSQNAFQPAPKSVPQAEVRISPQQTGRVCTKCGTKLPQEAMFCCGCGVSLTPQAKFCCKCGTEAVEGASFCHMCGSSL